MRFLNRRQLGIDGLIRMANIFIEPEAGIIQSPTDTLQV